MWKKPFGRKREQPVRDAPLPGYGSPPAARTSPQPPGPGPELIIGVDFAGPATASAQRKKIIALAAVRTGERRYRIEPQGINRRVLAGGPPGWTARELADALTSHAAASVVACDFPFSIPRALLDDPAFARGVGRAAPFGGWRAFNAFVGERLPLDPPVDVTPFAGWRSKGFWTKRATDTVAAAQPPLKDKFQVLFNMALLGNALLAHLAASGRYRVVPFGAAGPSGAVIEVYPGLTMRDLGKRDYKRDPAGAITTVLAHAATRGIAIELDPGIRRFCETYDTGSGPAMDPDGSDALVALVTAILYRERRAVEAVDPRQRGLVPFEGAIWRPA